VGIAATGHSADGITADMRQHAGIISPVPSQEMTCVNRYRTFSYTDRYPIRGDLKNAAKVSP
jgi:hypothetical protein